MAPLKEGWFQRGCQQPFYGSVKGSHWFDLLLASFVDQHLLVTYYESDFAANLMGVKHNMERLRRFELDISFFVSTEKDTAFVSRMQVKANL